MTVSELSVHDDKENWHDYVLSLFKDGKQKNNHAKSYALPDSLVTIQKRLLESISEAICIVRELVFVPKVAVEFALKVANQVLMILLDLFRVGFFKVFAEVAPGESLRHIL